MRKSFPIMVAAVTAGLALAGSASASTNLVTNGSFTSNGGVGELNTNTTLANWTSADPNYTFVFDANAATTGAPGQFGAVILYGSSNGGVSNPDPFGVSPDGGAFIGSDPAVPNSALEQVISGLTVGSKYELDFYWAADQQIGFSGRTTEGWNVTFGGVTQSVGPVSNPSHGFSGWYTSTMNFTATSSTQTLSFLATGGPNASAPPFALLDGVSLTAVPEATTWALMVMGFGGIGTLVRSRRRQLAATA